MLNILHLSSAIATPLLIISIVIVVGLSILEAILFLRSNKSPISDIKKPEPDKLESKAIPGVASDIPVSVENEVVPEVAADIPVSVESEVIPEVAAEISARVEQERETPITYIEKPRVETPKPSFRVSALSILPLRIESGGSAQISCGLENLSNIIGEYKVELKLNGEIVNQQKVLLFGGKNQTLKFSQVVEAPGEYTVEIDDLKGQLTILPKKEPEMRPKSFQNPEQELVQEQEVLSEPVYPPSYPYVIVSDLKISPR